jgi:hypothetical protein
MANALKNRISQLEEELRLAKSGAKSGSNTTRMASSAIVVPPPASSSLAPVAVEQNDLAALPSIPALTESDILAVEPAAGDPSQDVAPPVRASLQPPSRERRDALSMTTNPTNKNERPSSGSASPRFSPQSDMKALLDRAGVQTKEGVRQVAAASSDQYRAFRWKTNGLFGSAEQRPMNSDGQFQAAINDYLDRAKSRCGGEFAAVPNDIAGATPEAKAFEIACIGGRTNTSASVLFVRRGDVMTTFAHEGKADQMNEAMQAQEQIAAQMGSLMASR